ncbi:Pentatricopeptide repeat-containing protein family [Thalictrum thalictroides]|uniref:Pentatricopeptide repeat-containing protein family n=1 Tax=Thalictrum thalictroides TaxID=46969 RepID=A0A7J6V2Q6_THATH|nr:Pentatricopeptide repeat-containing protein family [Thalictrum thalictroides]
MLHYTSPHLLLLYYTTINDLRSEVTELSHELISNRNDSEKIFQILESKAAVLFRNYPDGSALVELLAKLRAFPHLALKVFDWRRKEAEADFPMVREEYAKGITIAGRLKNVDLAVMLFSEASMKGLKSASTYNALMGAYMYNGLADKCQSVFRDLKIENTFGPTIVTYNILLTVFGRLMLVDHTEATFKEIMNLGLAPNLNTFNHMIAGYLTAWMWDDMERVFHTMESSPVKPDLNTHLLMLRGYAHSGSLVKMENTYRLIQYHVDRNEMPLIRAMICAYCKSSDYDRVAKVEALLKLIPAEQYRPWLNVILIRLYAQEDLVDGMQSYINMAFEHNTSVIAVGVIRAIIATYFRCNALERLINFVKLAEHSGWRICRSLYHCEMVMYSSANRLEEMARVLDEMKKFNIDPTKKTFLIMYKAYSHCGPRSQVERLLGIMCKHGFEIPLDAFPF